MSAPSFEEIERCAQVVGKHWPRRAECGVVLGSGLGELADHFEDAVAIDYGQLPGFAESTAIGHRGRLVCGTYAGRAVVAMQGRFHLYEGHDAARATFAIRVLRALGASRLVVSNAAGGVNPRYQVGDLMVIDDHINFMFRSPLAGLNDPRWGERFVDLSRPYDNQLNNIALDAARRGQFVCHRGVYVGMLGPTYETRAEYRMVRELGGDAVGMSTVPEVIVARQLGMQVFGVSVVTNACSPDKLGETTGEQVVAVAAAAADRMPVLVEAVIKAGAEI